MTPTEQLIASLAALDNTSYTPSNSLDYFDWSTPGDEEGTVVFEVGNATSAHQIAMDRQDLISLQQRLTAYLLATA